MVTLTLGLLIFTSNQVFRDISTRRTNLTNTLPLPRIWRWSPVTFGRNIETKICRPKEKIIYGCLLGISRQQKF